MTGQMLHSNEAPDPRWERVKDLFLDALEVGAENRESLLAVADSEDPWIGSELRRLLSSHPSARAFFERLTQIVPSGEETQRLENGFMLSQRFEIVRFVARGGMGEVYEALDHELGIRVAVKTLRGHVEAHPGGIERFREEIRLARSISGTHVCRVHDVAVHGRPASRPIVYFTMEWIDGETLAEKLRRDGPLPLAEAREVARQLLEGLAAAHQVGVVHRDLKPSNILLSQTGGGLRVVITDFGLSRLLMAPGEAARGALMPSGATVRYAAPEQMAGGPISLATDIYAVGVVLHELLTGSVPSGSSTTMIRPWSWRRVIMRCLQQDPSLRWQSAAELADALHLREVHSWRLRLTAGTALAAGLLAVWLWFTQRPVTALPGTELLMETVSNGTGDARLDGVSLLLRRQLEQSPFLSVLPASMNQATLRAVRGQQAGVGPGPASDGSTRSRAVVRGVLQRSGKTGIDLDLQVEPLWGLWRGRGLRRSFHADRVEQLPSALTGAAAWVRASMGEPEDSILRSSPPVEQVTTSSWEALAAYQQSERWANERRPDLALAALEGALRIDPDFALAAARLGDYLMSVRRQSEAFAAYQRALRLAAAGRLSRREELVLKGNYYSDAGDYSAAEAALHDYVREYPHEYRASFLLGNVLRFLGRFPEALEEFRAADRKRPNASNVLGNLAMTYAVMGAADQVDAIAARLSKAGFPDEALYQQATAAALRGETEAAAQQFGELARSAASADLASRSISRQAQALAEAGRYRDAEEALSRGIAEDERHGDVGHRADKLLALAFLQLRNGSVRELRANVLDAVAANPSYTVLGKAATLFAWAGLIDEAQRVRNQLAAAGEIPQVHTLLLRLDGELALARGHSAEGLALMQQWDREEAPLHHRVYLARALWRAGERERAARRCASARNAPGVFWFYADYELPSLLAAVCN